MSEQITGCLCTTEGYSPDCPRVFLQGDTLLHSIDSEVKLKPRVYPRAGESFIAIEREVNLDPRIFAKKISPPSSPESGQSEFMQETIELNEGAGHAVIKALNTMGGSSTVPGGGPTQLRRDQYGKGNMRPDVSMLESNRAYLQKFEALEIGGRSITSATIGGFRVDLGKVAEKVREIAPLPPSSLPEIFKDDDLNFLHHFFQGLEIMMGRDTVTSIVKLDKYSDGSKTDVLNMIEGLIDAGYEKSDNEITLFTKKVLISTFEKEELVKGEQNHRLLKCVANMWGFQYLEAGMQCKDSDLKMWLNISYNHYRTVWFNVFKSAGVPQFVLDGVQTRYDSVGEMFRRDRTSERSPPKYGFDDEGVYHRRTRRHRRQREEESGTLVRTKNADSGWPSLFGGKN